MVFLSFCYFVNLAVVVVDDDDGDDDVDVSFISRAHRVRLL